MLKIIYVLFFFHSLQNLNEVLSAGDREKSREAFIAQVKENTCLSVFLFLDLYIQYENNSKSFKCNFS
jgi:hypothetical protein